MPEIDKVVVQRPKSADPVIIFTVRTLDGSPLDCTVSASIQILNQYDTVVHGFGSSFVNTQDDSYQLAIQFQDMAWFREAERTKLGYYMFLTIHNGGEIEGKGYLGYVHPAMTISDPVNEQNTIEPING